MVSRPCWGCWATAILLQSTAIVRVTIPAVQMLGVLTEDGQVDIDALYNAFAPKVTGPLEFAIPFVGALSLDRAEVDKLYRYIKEA